MRRAAALFRDGMAAPAKVEVARRGDEDIGAAVEPPCHTHWTLGSEVSTNGWQARVGPGEIRIVGMRLRALAAA